MNPKERTPVLERMKRRTVETPAPEGAPVEGPCWLWQGYIETTGYGSLTVSHSGSEKRRTAFVHRVGYEALVGPIPVGLHLDHLCRVRSCWNPRHLEPVTARTNILRGTSPSAKYAAQTECMRGHNLTEPENVYVPPRQPNRRMCRTCIKESRKARWEKEKEFRPEREKPMTCKRGHDLTAPGNVRIPANNPNHRVCRVCTRENALKYRQQQKGQS